MNKARMLKWAAFLETVPPEKFDMEVWGLAQRPVHKTPICATKACALGWATAIPEFNKAGLELRAYKGCNSAVVAYLGARGREAAMAFFGLDYEQAELLVYCGTDDPKDKAAEIRRMVESA